MITYRNDLLSKELDILISFFKKCEVGKISLVITGSLARGNPRIKDGKLESDIDILVIVDSIQQLISIKKTLEGRFHFVHNISLIFCLKERINRSRYRGIINSIRSVDNLLVDNLHIKNQIIEALDSPTNIVEQTRSMIQEFCYYSSKYLISKNNYLELKLEKYWKEIATLNHIDKKIKHLDFERIFAVLKEHKIQILDSSEYFFQNVKTSENIYLEMRDLVSLENQGLDFEHCILSLGER